jgi:acetylornithine deacetylase/succinyl-diaminopimelate desuccinylase-like protein
MSGLFRPLAALFALSAILASSDPARAQKPFDDPVLDRMQRDVFFLASPDCEGRGIETKGIERAANYIVESFRTSGLKPGMKDGTYFQPFSVTMSSSLGKPTTFALAGPNEMKIEPKLGVEYTPMGFSPTGRATGELVFAGFGISAPELKYDDYEGLDVEGKIVILFRRTPRYGEKGDRRFDTKVPAGDDSHHAFFEAKIEQAAKRKAAGLIVVNDTTGAAKTDPLQKYEFHATGTTPARFPVLSMKRSTFDEILEAGKWKSVKELEGAINDKLKPQSFELKGWSATAQVTVEKKEVKCKNIIGVLEGAGPLKDETVVIGAHYDHVGYGLWGSAGGKAASGKIHYGADDNASGTTGLMELARRFSAQKNRQGRRLVFIAFSAEEHGLDGSRHYCREPLFPLDSTAAMINLDMIGRTKPVPSDWLGLFEKKDRLLVYGTGTGEGFDKLVNSATKKIGLKVTKLPGGTGPSDHDSFYRKKVPVLFLYTGTHPEYHKPTDVPEKIDVPGMKKMTDFTELLLDGVLTRETKPKYVVVPGSWSDPTDPRAGRPTGPRLGVAPDYSFEGEGLRLDGVTPGGVADKAGLKEGDIIVEVAGKPVANITGYMTAMSAQKLGTTIDVVVERKGKKLTLKARLE